MTRNLKVLGLALLAVFALSAISGQVASAADHEFHSDGEKTIITGTNIAGEEHTFNVGAVGTVACKEANFQGTQKGTGSGTTWKTPTLTIKPTYSECTFGGQPATVFFHHCAYEFEGKTTLGNTTGNEHANVILECSTDNKVTIHTVNCTVTVGPQLIKDAVRYINELGVPSATKTISTAHGIVVGKERTTASQPVNGCLLFPTGAVGKYTGNTTNKCFRDDNPNDPPEGTEKTTPPAPTEGPTTTCSVNGAPTE